MLRDQNCTIHDSVNQKNYKKWKFVLTFLDEKLSGILSILWKFSMVHKHKLCCTIFTKLFTNTFNIHFTLMWLLINVSKWISIEFTCYNVLTSSATLLSDFDLVDLVVRHKASKHFKLTDTVQNSKVRQNYFRNWEHNHICLFSVKNVFQYKGKRNKIDFTFYDPIYFLRPVLT